MSQSIPTVLLETERLRLRRVVDADADHLYALDNDPEVMRYINGGEPCPRQAIEGETLPLFRRHDPDRPRFGFWAAEERSSGRFVGWFCLRASAERPYQAILGYRLRRQAWGRGYATEGARGLVDLGFRDLGLQRVVATTYEDNLPSQRVLEKLGFHLVHRFRLTSEQIAAADTYHSEQVDVWDGDDLEYALERDAWQREKP